MEYVLVLVIEIAKYKAPFEFVFKEGTKVNVCLDTAMRIGPEIVQQEKSDITFKCEYRRKVIA